MDSDKRSIYVNITAFGIFKIILILILFYVLFIVRDVLAVLFVSLILASALDPWIDWMQSKKIPRVMGVIIIYLLIFLAISSTVYLLVPPMVEQIKELGENLPKYSDKLLSGVSFLKSYSVEHGFSDNIKDSVGTINSSFQNAAGGVFNTIGSLFGSILSFFLVLVITFYMSVEQNAVKKIVWSVAPEKHQLYIMQLIYRMQKKIGLWLRGQLILSFIIFILVFIVLSILGVKYALVLAMLAGLTEFVPYLGPILAAIPAIFLAFAEDPMLAVVVAVMYYIIQLVENHIIVPKLMQKVVGLNPVIIIAVLLMGFKIAGVPGAILSIPVATAGAVFIKDIVDKKNIETEN